MKAVSATSGLPPSMYFDFDDLPPPEPEVERLRKEVTEAVRARQASAAALSEAKVAHAQEILGLRRELDATRTEMAEVQAASDAVVAELEADNSRITRELEILQSKAARLAGAEEEVKTSAEARTALENTIDELRKERSAARASVEKQTSKVNVVEARAIAAEVQVQRLTKQLTALHEEHSAKLRAASAQKEAVEREHRATKQRLEETTSQMDTIVAEKARLAQGLDALRTVHQEHIETAARTREEAQRQSHTLQANAAAAEERLEAAVRDLALLECENERLQAKSSELHTVAEENGSLKLKLSAAEEALAHARLRAQDLEDALASAVLNAQKPDVEASSPTRIASASPAMASIIQGADIQRAERIAQLIFQEFDADGDGYHSLDESRALTHVLTDAEVSESDFAALCEDLGANPAEGLSLKQFSTIYTDSSFGANAVQDYEKVFGKAFPT